MNIVLVLLSTLLTALSLPNEFAWYGTSILGFLCLLPYFYAVFSAKSRKQLMLYGFLFGALSHALGSYWLFFFKNFMFWTLGSTSIAYGIMHMIIALYLHEILTKHRSALVSRKQSEFRFWRPFLVAMLWTFWEYLKSRGFLGYPWGLVAYSLHSVDIITQIVDIFGVWGLTWLVSLINAILFELVLYSSRSRFSISLKILHQYLIFTLAITVVFAAYGIIRLSNPTPSEKNIGVVLVQHNADNWDQSSFSEVLQGAQNLSRKGIQEFEANYGKRPDLIVWSESVLARPYRDYQSFYARIPNGDTFMDFLQEMQIPLLVGGPEILDYQDLQATNSALLILPDGTIRYTYAKRQPVPFAESIPFWEYKWMRDFMRNVIGLNAGWVSGTEVVVMELPLQNGDIVSFGVPICFEDAFADVCTDFYAAGADLLINITNDSWSKTVSAETQHYVAAKFRTIEHRRVLIRSTNGGLTSVIDAEGRQVASLPFFEAAVLAIDVPIQAHSYPTLYAIFGDWLPLLFGILLVLRFFGNYIRERKICSGTD